MLMACSPISRVVELTATTPPTVTTSLPTQTVAPVAAATPSPVPSLVPFVNPTSAPSNPASGPTLAGCPLFPSNNIWNTPIDTAPVDPHSDDYIESIGSDTGLHPDFGAGLYDDAPIGIPYTVANATTPRADVTFDYDDESDSGPYPIPAEAPIEGGPQSDGDRHILIVEQDECKLYELYAAYENGDGTWHAGSGAIWDLRNNALRPADWTSADAAGLPILPGLVRYDEIAAGEINHALRFTAEDTQAAYIWPARHQASDDDNPNLPPLGQRFRLKASFDLTPYAPDVQIILRAMQRYGLILADNGSNWFISGAPDDRWNNDQLVEAFSQINGSNFEAVDVTSLISDPDSAQAKTP